MVMFTTKGLILDAIEELGILDWKGRDGTVLYEKAEISFGCILYTHFELPQNEGSFC